MRFPIVISAVAFLGLSVGTAFGDSAPENPPEPPAAPIEVSPVTANVAAPAQEAGSSKNRDVPALETTVVSASASAPAVTSAPVPVVETGSPEYQPENPANRFNAGKFSRQTVSSYRVNRVRVLLPAGIRVTVRKDWYSAQIVVVYQANPYTNWRGITPDALSFNHTGTTMELIPSGTKYLPAELTITVPSAVEVQVR